MATSVTLPALGESVTEGTVTRWLKQEGDTVEADEPLLEVSTDKVDTEIPSPAAGTLLSIKVQQDETVEVGAELAVIGSPAGDEGGASGGESSDGSAVETAVETGTDDAGSAEAADAAGTEDPEAVVDPASDAGSAGDAAPQPAPGSAAPSADGAGAGVGADEPAAAAEASEPPSAEASGRSGESGGSGRTSRGVSVTLPALGESVTEGTVTRWLKQEGDTVEADEPLLEVSTDKVDTEIPSPAAGTLLSIKVQQDETVEVGAELAVIGSSADDSGSGVDTGAGGGDASSGDESSGDESAVPADEQPAAVAEKVAAERQEADIQAEQPDAQPLDVESSGVAAPKGHPSGGGTPPNDGPSADAPSAAKPLTAAPPAAPAPQGSADSGDRGGQEAATSDGGYVTPLVRKLATEAGLDLTAITGTGVGGRIRKQDVLAAASAREAAQAAATAAQQQSPAPATAPTTPPAGGQPAPAAAAAPRTDAEPSAPAASASAALRGQTVKMTRMRAFIAKRMVESLHVSAQLTTVVEVDVTQIARLRNVAKAAFQEREGVKLSFLPFFAKASIEALRAYPQVNSSINTETNEVTYHAAEHLGIAVDTERGLIVPVIQNAGDLNIGGLARKIADLAERTRNNKVSPDELVGGTFTLTNTGSRGALFDTPILNQPQVGILGTGAVVKRAVVIDDPRLGETIVVRSMVYLALTYDHRIVDGADAARFLTFMKERLEEGKFESDLGL